MAETAHTLHAPVSLSLRALVRPVLVFSSPDSSFVLKPTQSLQLRECVCMHVCAWACECMRVCVRNQ